MYLDDHELNRKRVESGYIDRTFWSHTFGSRLMRTLVVSRQTVGRSVHVTRQGGRLVLVTGNPETYTESQPADAEMIFRKKCGS